MAWRDLKNFIGLLGDAQTYLQRYTKKPYRFSAHERVDPHLWPHSMTFGYAAGMWWLESVNGKRIYSEGHLPCFLSPHEAVEAWLKEQELL